MTNFLLNFILVWLNQQENKYTCFSDCISKGQVSNQEANSPQFMFESKFTQKKTVVDCDYQVSCCFLFRGLISGLTKNSG